MEISNQDLQNIPILNSSGHNNGGIIYIPNNKTLYKVFKDKGYFVDERKRNVDFFASNSRIEHTAAPKEGLNIDGEFSGYIMDNIINFQTLRATLNSNLPLDRKGEIIKDLYSALKELHQRGIVIGDMHLDNLGHDGNSGYIVDLDDVRMDGDEFKFTKCYLLMPKPQQPRIIMENKATDNVKMALSALSFLYQMNFETYIMFNSVAELQTLITFSTSSLKVKKAVATLEDLSSENPSYFDEYISSIIDDDIEKTKEELQKRM